MKSKIIKVNGAYCFQVDDKIIDSIAFKSFRPTPKNVGDFYKAGVRIFHVYCSGLPSGLKVPYSLFGETWFGDKNYDFTNLDKQIDFFKANAPEAYVFINIHLDVRDWWLKENPGNPNSFTHLSQIAANEKWRKDTADYLKSLIVHVEEKYNDFVMGYFLLGGYTTEWFSEFDCEESNEYKLKAYREYTKNDNILIPSKDVLEDDKENVLLRHNIPEIVQYREFHNKLVANLVLYLCHEAQTVLHHTKIVGVFFGYILELLNARMWNAGHIEYDLINQSEDIDILATPSSYQFRQYDSTGAYMLLCDSLEINKKACFASFDHTTFLVPNLPDNKERQCNDQGTTLALKLLAQMRSGNKKDLLVDKKQTIEAMRREFMQKTAKRMGFWWFDMFEGWFYDKDLMKEIQSEIEISKQLMNVDKKSISEVAVFFSGRSLYYLNKNSEINTETICNQREGLNRMGVPYDSFSLGDLNKIDINKYKLFIFIESLLLTDEQRVLINNLKSQGKSILFIGTVDYAKNSLESTKQMIDMNVGFLDYSENEVVTDESTFGYRETKKDSIYVDDNVNVLGTYKNSNKIAFCYKQIGRSKVFFSGIGNLDYKSLQKVLTLSEVHIYSYDGEAVFVTNNLFGIYAPLHNQINYHLKENGVYKDLFTNNEYVIKDKSLVIDTSINKAHLLLKTK